MPIAIEKKANVTAFAQNCLLHCAAHKIIGTLLNKNNEALANPQDPFQLLAAGFNTYYDLNPKKTLADIKQLFGKFTHPIDQEYILGPVLRECLVTVMQKDGADSLLTDEDYGFKKVIADFLETENIAGTSCENLARSNENYLTQNQEKLKKWRISDRAVDADIDKEIENYWQKGNAAAKDKKSGFKQYLDFIKDGAVELSAFEADFLFHRLGIAIQDKSLSGAYTPKTGLADEQRIITLGVQLVQGHWYYEADDAVRLWLQTQGYPLQ